MKCPVCKEVNLVMSDRQGVEIDYCPQCRGVWLDRGELDKIIERSAVAGPVAPAAPYREYPGGPERREYEQRGREYDARGHGHGHKKKKESFLSDLFDF